MQKIRKNLPLVAIIGILFATGIVFSHAFTKTKLGTSTVLADEEESSSGERDSDSSNNRDDDEKDSISNRDEENDNESDKEDDEKSSEVRRVRTTTQGTTVRTENENDNEDGDKVENDNENDSQEGIQELNKDIAKIEARISVLSANGISVTSLTATLSEIKDLASQAQAKLVSAPKEAESLIETADHKLERLSKLVKLTLGDEDENDDSNDATEEIQGLAKDVVKIEVRLNAIASRGIDVYALKLSLNEVKDLLDQAKDKATAGDLTSAEALTELADKKLETLKHAMELAFGDDEKDGDEADEYKSEVASFVHNLKEISDIDGGIGQQVKVVAQAQNDSASKVEESMNEVNDRSGFVKFLIGPKYGSIAEIQTAITENQTRIKVLTDLLNQITDPAVKLVLQDQIKQFQQENTRLQAFVTESESGISLFGWLMKIFA